MKLITIDDVRKSHNDVVFGPATLRFLVLSVLAFSCVLGSVIAYFRGADGEGSLVIGLFCSVIGLLTFWTYRKNSSPHSWLVITDEKGMFIHVRSGRNRCEAVPRPVFRIDFNEIKSARVTRVALKLMSRKKKTNKMIRSTVINWFIDLEVEPEQLDVLSAAIKQEYAMKYDGGAFLSYPVSTPNGHTIRLDWSRVRGSTRVLIDRLRDEHVNIDTENSAEVHDFTFKSLENVDEVVLKEKVMQMVGYGHKWKAEKVIRHIYKCSPSEAERTLAGFVEAHAPIAKPIPSESTAPQNIK